MRLFAEIESRMGVKLAVASIFEARTVEQLAALVEAGGAQESWRSLVAVATGASGRPLFCVHGAGGEVALFAELGRRMGSARPFYALQAQGLDGESPVLTSVEQMASHYLVELRDVQPSGPYLLAGMCMGGLVAFEMAQQLRAAGEEVLFLGVIDSPGPRRTDPDRVPERPHQARAPRPLRHAARDARRQAKRRARSDRPLRPGDVLRGFWWRPLKALRRWRRDLDKWRDRRIRAWRRWRKGTRRAIKQRRQWLKRVAMGSREDERSLPDRCRDVLGQLHPDRTERTRRRIEVINRAAARDYVAAPYAGVLSVLHCRESASRPNRRRIVGWESAVVGDIEHIVVAGSHQTLLRPPAVQELADLLLARLDEAEHSAAGAPAGSARAIGAPEPVTARS